MYCVHCGKAVAGKFCSECGSLIQAPPATPQPPITDWTNEVRYDVLIQIPAVRDRIAEAASQARQPLSGEEFLRIAEKAFSKYIAGVPLSKIAAFVQPIYKKWGIGTGDKRSLTLSQSIGTVLEQLLCSLARAGQKISRVQQAEDGCVIEAVVPSDMWSFAADLIIHVQRDPAATRLQAAVRVHGQLYDWGKSRRCLDILIADLQQKRAAS